jgi:hypothetical protein
MRVAGSFPFLITNQPDTLNTQHHHYTLLWNNANMQIHKRYEKGRGQGVQGMPTFSFVF